MTEITTEIILDTGPVPLARTYFTFPHPEDDINISQK